jgi:hypothetical protein
MVKNMSEGSLHWNCPFTDSAADIMRKEKIIVENVPACVHYIILTFDFKQPVRPEAVDKRNDRWKKYAANKRSGNRFFVQ